MKITQLSVEQTDSWVSLTQHICSIINLYVIPSSHSCSGTGRRNTGDRRMSAFRQHTQKNTHTHTQKKKISLTHTHMKTHTVKIKGLTTGKSTYSLRKSWDMNWVKSPKSAESQKNVHTLTVFLTLHSTLALKVYSELYVYHLIYFDN